MLDVESDRCLIALGSELQSTLMESEVVDDSGMEIIWVLQQSNENANLFFQAMFGKPEGAKMELKQLGERLDQATERMVPVAVIECRLDTPNPTAEKELTAPGFRQFVQFALYESLRSELTRLGIEP
jgi:hypothetical protein